MAFNKYTQITPAKYDARSLQETLYLPTLKRKQHDQLESQAAVTKSQLDKFDALDEYSDMAQEEKERLTSQMDSFSEQLAKQGVNNSSKSKFLDIAGDYSKATSESGKLYKIDAIKKKYLADKERILADANAKGYDPQMNLVNLEKSYKNHFDNNDIEDLNYIDLPEAPEYYDVASFLNEFKGEVGATAYNEIIQSGAVKYEGGVFKITDESKISKNNLDQLTHLNDLAQSRLLNKGSKGYNTANWQGKPIKEVEQEINSAIKMKTQVSEMTDLNTRVNLSNATNKSSSTDTPEEPGNYFKTLGDYSLGLTDKFTLDLKKKEAQKNYDEAVKSNDPKAKEEAAYNLRKYNNIENEVVKPIQQELQTKLDQMYGNIYHSMSSEKASVVQNYFENNTETPEIGKPRYVLRNQISGKDDAGFIDKQFGDGKQKRFISIMEMGPNGKQVETDRISLTSEEYSKINNAKTTESFLKAKYDEDINTKLKEEYDPIIGISPEFASPTKRIQAYEEAIHHMNTNAVKPDSIVIRDIDGEQKESNESNSDLNTEVARQNIMNYLGNNPDNLNITDFIPTRIGNKTGYTIKVSPTNEDGVTIDRNWLNTDIEKGETLEIFVPLKEADMQQNNGTSFFASKFLNNENKKAFNRGIEFGNYQPTSDESQLGKHYQIPASKFTENYNSKHNVDFLKTENGIELHKVNISEGNNESIGKVQWSDIYKKSIDGNISPNYQSEIDDLIFEQALTNEQRQTLINGNMSKQDLLTILEESKIPVRLKNKSQMEILLAATKNL